MDQGLLFDRLTQKLRSEFHPILADPMLFHNGSSAKLRNPGRSPHGTRRTLSGLPRLAAKQTFAQQSRGLSSRVVLRRLVAEDPRHA
jgi:hypothetical protein